MNPDERPFMPLEGYRLLARQIDSWCTNEPMVLLAGIHFPNHMPFDDLKKRLKKAAKLRQTYMRIWPTGNGQDYWLHLGKVHPDWKWH